MKKKQTKNKNKARAEKVMKDTVKKYLLDSRNWSNDSYQRHRSNTAGAGKFMYDVNLLNLNSFGPQ